jgi:hypothetical protein
MENHGDRMSDSVASRDGPSIDDAALARVVASVRHYAENHPGLLDDIWYESSPRRVVALLAGDETGVHEAALRTLTNPPDQLEIKHSQWPPGHLERIGEEIRHSAQGALSGMGSSKGVLRQRLWADQANMAASLRERYGDAIAITVGQLTYPDGHADEAEEIASGSKQPDVARLPDEVSLSLEAGVRIRSGSHVGSTLTIRNDSAREVVVGKLIPSIVDLANGRVVGGYEGAITLEMRRYQVPAGSSKDVPILIGTASTRSDLGYAVPPGRWALRIVLQIGEDGFQALVPIEILP